MTSRILTLGISNLQYFDTKISSILTLRDFDIQDFEGIPLFLYIFFILIFLFRSPIGAVGLLQVMDSHKRRGLGSLMVTYMAKLLSSKNEDALAAVVTTNTASRDMFAKLGFTIIDNVYWSLIKGEENYLFD